MDHIRFGQLVSFVTSRPSNAEMDPYELSKLENLASECFRRPTVNPAAEQVRDLLRAMAESRKIDAIRTYKILTEDTLLEAKNAVEAAMSRCS